MKCLHFIFSHSLFVSLCAAALTFHSASFLNLHPGPWVLALVFFCTLFTYNVYWIFSSLMLNSGGFSHFRRVSASGFLTSLLGLFGMAFCFMLVPSAIMYLLPAALLTFLYFIPLAFRNRPDLLVKAGPVKTFLLAVTWAYVTVFPVLSVAESDYNPMLPMLFVHRFFFMLMLCIIFDSRDVETDKVRSLHSLATSVSRRVLSVIFALSFLLFAAFSMLLYMNDGTMAHLVVSVFTGISAAALFIASARKRSYLFYYFLVDGLMILLTSSSFICCFFD